MVKRLRGSCASHPTRGEGGCMLPSRCLASIGFVCWTFAPDASGAVFLLNPGFCFFSFVSQSDVHIARMSVTFPIAWLAPVSGVALLRCTSSVLLSRRSSTSMSAACFASLSMIPRFLCPFFALLFRRHILEGGRHWWRQRVAALCPRERARRQRRAGHCP